jgi:hypothetical protein
VSEITPTIIDSIVLNDWNEISRWTKLSSRGAE